MLRNAALASSVVASSPIVFPLTSPVSANRAQVIDDQQRHGHEIGEIRFAGAVECRVSEFLEERVGLAIDDAVPLLDHRSADRLGEMALPRAWWSEKERVLASRDETAGGELVD
jgi:hypothetical protein